MTAVTGEIRFVRSADGTRIAWARHGQGPALLRVATWMTHLERDWDSPVWRHWLVRLGEHFTVIRYDDRGSGLSDREPADISFEAWLADLHAVADAAGYDRYVLLGMSHAAAVAVAYAARRPERVRALVLYGGYLRGSLARDLTAAERDEREVMFRLFGVGWGRSHPDFRRIFTDDLLPAGSEEQRRWYDELQRVSAAPAAAERMARARARIDVTDLAGRITVPTLVLHAVNDVAVPFDLGRELAAAIPGARFVPLPGRDHILLAEDPGWRLLLTEVVAFAGAGTAQAAAVPTRPLSRRELGVLDLVARGLSNEEIGTALGLSVRTVERHLANVYAKLGLAGKSARAAAAARFADLARQVRAT